MKSNQKIQKIIGIIIVVIGIIATIWQFLGHDAEQQVYDTSDYMDQEAGQEIVNNPQRDERQEIQRDVKEPSKDSEESEDESYIYEDGIYYDKDSVAAYIATYHKLPSNYITKKQAKELGWSGGSLEEYAPGKAIGGDYFGNYEEVLPKAQGREYHECDIDTYQASKRGAKRIVFSNDGLIYYTEDHYETFILLYDNES